MAKGVRLLPLLFPQDFFVRLLRYSSDSLGGSFRPIQALFDFRVTIFLRLALVLMEIKFIQLRPGANLERLNVAGLAFHKASFYSCVELTGKTGHSYSQMHPQAGLAQLVERLIRN
jgi:hypothetical protein